MLSDTLTLAALVGQAPALVLAAAALAFAGWAFRQSRRADTALEARVSGSNVRQGERLGRVEHDLGLLDMRRRITEEELYEIGIRLSFWPPDGAYQPRARRDEEDRDALDDTTRAAPSIPPLPESVSRHRR